MINSALYRLAANKRREAQVKSVQERRKKMGQTLSMDAASRMWNFALNEANAKGITGPKQYQHANMLINTPTWQVTWI